MLDVLYLGYVQFFAVVLPASAVAIITIGALHAALSGAALARAILIPVILISAWYVVGMYLSSISVFNVPATLFEPPVVLGFLFGGATLLWILARYTTTGLAVSNAVPISLLAAFQIPRVMGALFLVGWAMGDIPWQFALPAGVGDVWAGVAGYQAWKASRAGAPDARQKLVWATIIGMCDFLVAVLTGIATSEGFMHIWAHDAPNIINLHPLAMFPGFFVPLFLAFHLVLISRLRQEHVGVAQAT